MYTVFMAEKVPITRLDRSKAALRKMTESSQEIPGYSPAELLGFMWELTREIYSLWGDFDAEQRLQRNVANFIRQ